MLETQFTMAAPAGARVRRHESLLRYDCALLPLICDNGTARGISDDQGKRWTIALIVTRFIKCSNITGLAIKYTSRSMFCLFNLINVTTRKFVSKIILPHISILNISINLQHLT